MLRRVNERNAKGKERLVLQSLAFTEVQKLGKNERNVLSKLIFPLVDIAPRQYISKGMGFSNPDVKSCLQGAASSCLREGLEPGGIEWVEVVQPVLLRPADGLLY